MKCPVQYPAASILGLVIAALVTSASASMAEIANRRLYLIGNGAVASAQGCSVAQCSGRIHASVKGTPQVFRGDLDLPIQVDPELDEFTQCRKVTGRGFLKDEQFAVRFVGELCQLDPAARFGLRGQIQIFANTQVCAAQRETVAVGTLEMFGAISAEPTLPIPFSNTSVVSIVGIAGSIPICDP